MHDLLYCIEDYVRIHLRPVKSAIMSWLDLAELTVDSDKPIFAGDEHDGARSGAVYGAPCPYVG